MATALPSGPLESPHHALGTSAPTVDYASYSADEPEGGVLLDVGSGSDHAPISRLEHTLIAHPPVFQVLLLHLPTQSILDLYLTSPRLRKFLQSYPLAWKNLSFRRRQPELISPAVAGPGADSAEYSASAYSISYLLRSLVPLSTRLTRLDLDNSSVSGSELYSQILIPRRATLQHLSVRNCRHVSLKYHIVNFLYLEYRKPKGIFKEDLLALKSLYTFRCRHHRKRPYLRTSLGRRDADAFPTHQLIHICHLLGIWTDTGWCTTPGARCSRRMEYALGRVPHDSALEIWVPFDRLWRSQNYHGPFTPTALPPDQDCIDKVPELKRKYGYPCPDTDRVHQTGPNQIGLWEDEYGYSGEPLGSGVAPHDQGKELSAHLRESYSLFIQGVTCDECGDEIYERCESCSLLMHCDCCRKTLCASCAFDRPLPRKRRKRNATTSQNPTPQPEISTAAQTPEQQTTAAATKENLRFWWPPDADRSPNIVNQNLVDEDDSSDEDGAGNQNNNGPHGRPMEAKITSHPCCTRVNYYDPPDRDARAVPSPPGKTFDDPWLGEAHKLLSKLMEASQFVNAYDQVVEDNGYPIYSAVQTPPLPPWSTRIGVDDPPLLRSAKRTRKVAPLNVEPILQFLISGSSSNRYSSRSLCAPCYKSASWHTRCAFKDCQNVLCIEHDVTRLRVRQCGSRSFPLEFKALLEAQPNKSSKAHAQEVKQEFKTKWTPVAESMQKLCLGTEPEQTSASSNPQSATVFRSAPITRLRSSSEPAPPESLGFRSRPDYSPLKALEDDKPRKKIDIACIPRRCIFTGCGRLFCPALDERHFSDVRPACPGSTYLTPCASCGVFACYDCSGMEMGCPCSGCTFALRDRSKFQCPGCEGDWRISEQVRKRTAELVENGERWPSVDRGGRFWRCRYEEESQVYADLVAEKAKLEKNTEKASEDVEEQLEPSAPLASQPEG